MPKLSIVVPVYNVERYLDACLASVQEQELDDIQVVVVDDGSPDASAEIARRWCERDSRFELVRQDNHGLGHARNTGARAATGEYLTFLDSDDLVPPKGYETMVGMLDASGSDVCTGAVRRLMPNGARTASGLHAGIHRVRVRGTTVAERTALLRDRLAVNKVWRRSFWEAHGCQFPVGVLYEDIPTIIPALVTAGSIDIVPRVVYLWRKRALGPAAITEDRTDIRHVRDRAGAVTAVSAFLAEAAPGKIKRLYDHSVLANDLDIFLNHLDVVDDEYGRETLRLVRDFLQSVDRRALRRLDAATRFKYHLAEQDELQAMQRYAAFLRDGGLKTTSYVVSGDAVVLDVPQRKQLRVPDDVLDDAPSLELVDRTTDITCGDKRWKVGGWAYIRGLPIDRQKAADIRVWLAPKDGQPVGRRGRASQLRVRRWADPQPTVDAGRALDNYDWARFEADIPLRRLVRAAAHSDEPLYVFVEVSSGPVTRKGILRTPDRGRVRSPDAIPLDDGGWLRPRWGRRGLVLDPLEPQVQLAGVRAVAEGFLLYLSAPSQVPDGELIMTTGEQRTTFAVSWGGTRSAEVVVPVPVPEDRETPTQLHYRAGGTRAHKLRLPTDQQEPLFGTGRTEFVLKRTQRGHGVLVYRSPHPRLRGARWLDNATLELDVDLAEDVAVEPWYVHARRTRERRPAAEVARDGRRRTIRVFLGGTPGSEEDLPVPNGWWRVGGVLGSTDLPLVVPSDAAAALPEPVEFRGRRYRVDFEFDQLFIHVGSQLGADELGPHRQHVLQHEDYPRFLQQPLRGDVVYDCYGGTQWTDNPRVLHDELARRDGGLGHLVIAWDQQARVSDSATEVPLGSREHYRAMAQSRVVVLNSFQPPWFGPRDEQLVIQTWHGTALKTIGTDNKAAQKRGPRELDRIRALAATWSWIVSPSPFMTEVSRSTWDYQGRIVECGYPRNDIFYAQDAKAIADRTRAHLDVAAHQRLILYAPTFRDQQIERSRRHRMSKPLLDIAALCKRLGPDDVLVVRSHHLAGLSIPTHPSLPVRDASRYPHVQHLLVSADVLVTDYSSVMFDYANTGRPMYFFTPDLDDYQAYVRGFYFDLEALAPGPVLRRQDDLATALSGDHAADYADRYAAFRQRFCPWDDGGAAARLADAILQELEGG